MIEKEITIKNKYGLHARPSATFVQAASQFKSDIALIKGDKIANGKSIISIMVLAAECGSKLKLQVDGEDQEEALETLTQLVDNKFNSNEEDL